MTTLREAAQQALDALYQAKEFTELYDTEHAAAVNERCHENITALRAALAQQPEPPPPLWPPTGLEPRGCPLPGACSCPSESVRSTHSEDCWQWHQACAVAAVIRLRAEVARLSKRDGE